MITKLLSARFWLALLVGFTFVYCACNNIIDKSDTMQVILLVIACYFSKNRT